MDFHLHNWCASTKTQLIPQNDMPGATQFFALRIHVIAAQLWHHTGILLHVFQPNRANASLFRGSEHHFIMARNEVNIPSIDIERFFNHHLHRQLISRCTYWHSTFVDRCWSDVQNVLVSSPRTYDLVRRKSESGILMIYSPVERVEEQFPVTQDGFYANIFRPFFFSYSA